MLTRRILVFEDHGADWLNLLDLLLIQSQSSIMRLFVTEAASILRQEIGSDSNLSKQASYSFTSLQDLRDRISKEPKTCPLALQSAITCLSQIGLFVDHLQRRDKQVSWSGCLPLGFGIGAISAAVAAHAQGIDDILTLSPYAISLSFRIGSLAQRTLGSLHGHCEDTMAWASITIPLPEPDITALVKEFNEQTHLPHRKCHLTSISESYSIISGHPTVLEAFKKEHDFTTDLIPSIPTNISDLYLKSDVSSLCASVNPHKTARTFEYFSTTSGMILEFHSGYEVLQHVTRECLSVPKNTSKTFSTLAKYNAGSNCTITILRQSQLAQHIQNTLQANSNSKVLLEELVSLKPDSTNHKPMKSPIAIVGMAGRFPEADDAEKLWELLQAGKDVHRTVPPDRFNFETHSDPTGVRPNTSKTPYGCFIEQPGLFDARFFNMSPKEAKQTDPAQRLMILTAYEALEMAGVVPDRTPSTKSDRVATFYGQASDDWREVNSSQNIDTYFIPGGIRAFGPGRINYHLKFSGPSFSVDTACSSSFAAIHMACNSLWLKDCDTALAGGANILTNPDIFAGLSRGHFLSSTGSCKTFDAGADGYCRADGVASVVLKRLEDAENDHDNILGLITAIGTNHSADAVSITHPHAPTQAKLYQSLLSDSGVDAHDVDVVEMHGTGTAAGDYNEVLSVTDVFAPRHRRQRDRPLYIGSVKANLGHAEAAAGITSLVKTLQMLRHNTIAPHVGVKGELNSTFPEDLENRRVVIPFKAKQWNPRPDGAPRSAFLNNFSAAGGNTGLVLQEYLPHRSKNQRDPRSYHILTVSARSIRSIQTNIERLASFVHKDPQIELSDLSYTLTARRITHSYRKSFVVSNVSQVSDALTSCLSDTFTPVDNNKSVVFTFTGQGSMYTSLAKALFQNSKSFNRSLLDYDRIAQSGGFPSFLSLVDGSETDIASLQPTILHVGQVCVQLALARFWISWGIKPSAVIGHSLGEYPALAVAGVLSDADMIYLVGTRAQLLESNCTPESHGMAAIISDLETLAREVKGTSIEVSCVNAPGAIVLGGPRDELNKYLQTLQTKGTRHVKLPMAYAFHTAQIQPIMKAFAAVADRIDFSQPQIPFLSPLLGQTVEAHSLGVLNANYLCRQARECVDFKTAVETFRDHPDWNDQTVWLEIGPNPTCTKFVQHILDKATPIAHSLHRDTDPWKSLLEAAGKFFEQGFDIDWEEFHRDFENCHQLIEIPAYAWDLKNFWIDYVNDWCLTKGDMGAQPVTQDSQPRIQSSSVHKILKENYNKNEGTVLAETRFSDPMLLKKAQGHRVNGTSLCPSTLYAEIVLTLAKYMYKRINPDGEIPAIDVYGMTVGKTLIVEETTVLRISAAATTQHITFELYSVDSNDETKKTIHGTCEARYGAVTQWTSKWTRNVYLVKERISALEDAAHQGHAHRIQRNLVYRLFSNFVDYDEEYQGIQEVILNSPHFEATASVYLNPIENGAVFDIPPTWIDSLCHLTGVILNASDAVDSKTFVYISHGWKSLRILPTLKPGATYRTYTRMQETENNIMEGDVWMFDGEGQVVGLARGIRFQRIPRKVINILLPQSNSSSSKSKTPTQERPTKISLPPQPSKDDSIQPAQEAATKASEASAADEVLLIIAAECGIDLSELVDGCKLKSLGIDSLLSLEILAKVRESLGLDLRPHVFYENETIGDLRAQLQQLTGSPAAATKTSPDAPTIVKSDLGTPGSSSDVSTASESTLPSTTHSEHGNSPPSSGTSTPSGIITPSENPAPKVTSYLLSGNTKTASKFLFLFPDGSGSATSYATLPPFAHDTCVYAMNCPFMTKPAAWTGGISAVTDLYLKEIYRRKPKGPYNVAGWSAGGILAYEAALQLQKRGEIVERMILIDSPCPVSLPPMPVKMFRFLDSLELLGSGNAMGTPGWLIPHFEATVRNLATYDPTPFASGDAPLTTMIWARRGVTSKTNGQRPPREDGDPPVMDWLLEDRTEFGSNGWEALIPGNRIQAETMDGHHFSMTNEHVNELGRLMAEAMV